MPPKNNLRNLSEAEFQRVFKEVRSDINDLQMHDKIFTGVIEELGKYERISINFPAFFTAFLSAMRTDLVIRLGRIYDPESSHDSCTLARCLSTLRDNPQFFTPSAVTARLNEVYRKGDPDYLSFHRLDLKRIETDLDKITKIRQRLINLRHKVYAHKDLETVLSGKQVEFLSTHEEVKELIRLAHDVWNHYSLIWNASTWTTMTIGEDDYKYLFTTLRRGMKTKTVSDTRRTNRIIQHINSLKEGKC
jgi:hypothetical protein